MKLEVTCVCHFIRHAVVIAPQVTNHVVRNLSGEVQPGLGVSWSHVPRTRILLERLDRSASVSTSTRRSATLVKSSRQVWQAHPPSSRGQGGVVKGEAGAQIVSFLMTRLLICSWATFRWRLFWEFSVLSVWFRVTQWTVQGISNSLVKLSQEALLCWLSASVAFPHDKSHERESSTSLSLAMTVILEAEAQQLHSHLFRLH